MQSVSFREDIMGAVGLNPATARPVQTTSREFLTAVLTLEPQAAATSASAVSHISGKASTAVHCVQLIFCSSHSGEDFRRDYWFEAQRWDCYS